MRFTQQEKYEIILLVESSEIGVNRTLKEIGIHKSTFYNWYNRYLEDGFDGLAPKPGSRNTFWNKIPDKIRTEVVNLALDYPEESARNLACKMIDEDNYYISESSVYRILRERGLVTQPAFSMMAAADEYKDKTTRINQMWQTDFTYMKIISWGWYYLSTVLDDYSRYIIHWELCSTMTAIDVQRTLDSALKATGLSKSQRPKLLSDNGPCYISNELKQYVQENAIKHIRGKPNHPQTQGKIERYHRSMKNIIKLDNYYFPEQLKERLAEFVDYYNNRRYHESLKNLTPADVYFNRGDEILKQRQIIKNDTMKKRRKKYLSQVLRL
jgi:putative transposase